MTRMIRLSVAAAALSCTMATPVFAQDVTVSADELAAMRAQLKAMNDRIDQLEGELAAAKQTNEAQDVTIAAATEAAQAKPEPAPAEELSKSDGWSFKPRGRLMFDAGFTSVPGSTGRSDGFGNEVRRARLGASGDIPGGFGYKFELDFAGNEVEAADAYLSYSDGPIEVIVGHQNNFQSLEELTSSLHTTFIERAAFTDAFGFERRIGASVTYNKGAVLAQAGVFTDNFADTETNNRGADARLVFMPKMGDTQLHFGGSIHYNDLAEDGATVRYRQRPLVHFTSERFINTGNLDADSEFGLGLEAAAVAGPFHAAAEGYWQTVTMPGAMEDPTFFGGYAEAGIFLTGGDTRGYKGGKFDRSKPANPLGKGGLGSLQFNLRYDYLDLNDAGVLGGTQNGYLASLIWKPNAYVLFGVNYGMLEYDNAVYPTADGDTSYTVDAFGVRAQVDF
ncbi:OprO/OprP family phosphate-selective porin [Qipengyuania sp. 6B39]|uniref:OprO/OprP family phosphate-selective porin n=1 Tax=Qipengyuania proteolytica TaxID=2867239 RepID=UPI001C88F48D|nr:porin [Qipengyuania proteolytica]MBX7495955.1 OprO/OprP family phosphate-selective porin [Qipengyuania proteolytica]